MAVLETRKAPCCRFFVEMISSEEEHDQVVNYLLTEAAIGFFNHSAFPHSQRYSSKGGKITIEDRLYRFTYGFSDENTAFDVRIRFTKP